VRRQARRRTGIEIEQKDLFAPVNPRFICGVDEAGRGPLAGPVFAAAVILDPAVKIAGIADSTRYGNQGWRRRLVGCICQRR
jgi:hypothetical protein